MKVLLWLDDVRNPSDDNWLPLWAPVKDYNSVVWVKSYNEFVSHILDNGLPYCICFDHDLADIYYIPHLTREGFNYHEQTGLDCAKWLVDYCFDLGEDIPPYRVHSANPIGAENIRQYLENAKKHLK